MRRAEREVASGGNRWTKLRAKTNCRPRSVFADDGPNPEQVFASTEIREMISENLDELSPLLRTAFVLREVQGYSTGEAAKKLGVTENTLKARLWRRATPTGGAAGTGVCAG